MGRTREVTARGTWRRAPGREGALVARSAIHAESQVLETPVEWELHEHALHELVWVRGGALTARVGERLFTVPAGYGLWLPAGVRHGGRLTAGVELSSAFFAPDRSVTAFPEAVEVAMSPVLDSLLTHLARPDLEPAARSRAEGVVFDVLEPAGEQLAITVPDDPRIAPVVRAIIDDPADDRGLEEWAAVVGASERTVTRVFRDTTGLAFARWRLTVRAHRAMSLLSEGWEVQDVSDALGYAQTSTFIAAFRRVTGRTPGSFRTRS
ncbi:helix-turn-helix domain-containing protein [Curtobacterium pusillum]|uniref:helix-turn-helix domain-containing protein n=1 Tax=Curtobacterium pusillum TaxID=69373 RepID=UPI0037FD4506